MIMMHMKLAMSETETERVDIAFSNGKTQGGNHRQSASRCWLMDINMYNRCKLLQLRRESVRQSGTVSSQGWNARRRDTTTKRTSSVFLILFFLSSL